LGANAALILFAGWQTAFETKEYVLQLQDQLLALQFFTVVEALHLEGKLLQIIRQLVRLTTKLCEGFLVFPRVAGKADLLKTKSVKLASTCAPFSLSSGVCYCPA
jgi:hypothetical protein